MPKPLNILIVEDSQDDADLALRELRRAGFDPKWKRVETELDFLTEIKNLPDVVLSDYSMPQFSGLRAAELLQQSGLNIPFILISGTVGEEVAVEAMRRGATDYLLKDRIARLGVAVEHALEQKHLREERKQIEEELRITHEKLRHLLAHSPAVIYTLKIENHIITPAVVSDNIERLLGFTVKEASHYDWWVNQLHPEDHDRVLGNLAHALSHDGYSMEYRIRHKDGTYVWVEDKNRVVLDISRQKIAVGVWTDITRRKQAEEKLRLLGSAMEESKESIIITEAELDPPGPKIIFANHAFTQMTGYTVEEVIGKTPRLLQGPRTDRTVLNRLRKNLEQGEVFEGEAINYRKDGQEFNLEWQIAPIRNHGGKITHFVATQHDITARKKLEEQFRQSQKMESIGQLASGVAHDFNNILGIIQMQSDLLKTKDGLSPVQSEIADEIGAAVQRAAALTRQLLLFSRKEALQMRELDLNESINDMTKMLRRSLCEDIQLQFKFAMQALCVYADAGMMDQVLMNLAVNARDAMPKGGLLIIETSTVEFDEAAASHSVQSRPGSFVCLSVGDTGCGIQPEILPKIFDPFFTTKDVGKGTGLGLATVFGIVQQHKGWINVYSEVGQGTTFRVYLPRLARISDQKVMTPTTEPSCGGDETILIVEDEPRLRASVRNMLSSLGYHVLEASDGITAQEVWKQNRDNIQLLLTDMVMPGGINGKELAEQFLKENPKLKVIYASGYSEEVASKDFPLKEGVNFLTKPFQAKNSP